MAAREQMGTNVEPGIISRIAAGVRYAISGVAPDNFFGPMQPLPPAAQDKVEGRAQDYPVGVNLRIQPRNTEVISFGMLRALADGYDLMRLVIETRKDQVEAFEWEIIAAKSGQKAPEDQVKKATDFLQQPDREHDWGTWLRMQLEDLFVLDAMVVYPRMTKGGDLYSFDLIDPGTITRKVDETGRTPMPPDVAYQQVIKGIPACDYTSDMLVYAMRNPRTNRFYGYSPVEQVMMTVNIALRRQVSQLEFYTSGNVPEALVQVPENWTPEQIAKFQLWWDSVMEGNTAARRKMRFLPKLDGIVFPKKETLKDEYDEWLARIVCFAFSVAPTALIKQVNRASGEQMADTAKEEGLMPLLRFLEGHMTRLVQKYLRTTDVKFSFKVVNRVNPVQQADIDKIYSDLEAITADEIREKSLGLDPMTPEERDEAFPTPIPPGINPDGSPVLPKGAPNSAVPAGGGTDGVLPAGGAGGTGGPPDPKKPAIEPTPTEKMLADALAMLDPEKLAKVARLLAPNIVEVKPQVDVSVGDTNIHLPVERGPRA